MEGDTLYYIAGDRIGALDLISGETLWSTMFAVRDPKETFIRGYLLYVPGERSLFAFDKVTGKFAFQVSDIEPGFVEGRDPLIGNYGLVTELDGGVLISSSEDGALYRLVL